MNDLLLLRLLFLIVPLQIVFKTCIYYSLFYFKVVWIFSAVSMKSGLNKTIYVFPVETLMVSRRGTSRSSTRN